MASLDPERLRLLRQEAQPRARRRWLLGRLDEDDRAALAKVVSVVIMLCLVCFLFLVLAAVLGEAVHIFRMVSS